MSDGTPPTNEEFSDQQIIVNWVIQICSSSLSVIGSTTIVYKIIRDWRQNRFTTPYDRIVLGLSSCDILASITFAADQFLYPSGLAPWAFGSPAACQAHGFLSQTWPFWANWYNLILSWYFLLMLLSQLRRKDFVRKCELWMHLSGIHIPIIAIIGLRLKWYDADDSLVCWVTDPAIKWIVAGMPTLFVYFNMIINYSAIFIVVHKTLRLPGHDAAPTLEQKMLKREAATLMLLYVASFSVTASFPFICQAMVTYYGYTARNSSKTYYAMTVLRAIFMPLQGFFNVFIYIMPSYTRFRAANPNKPMHFVVHQALFNPVIPQLHYPSTRIASNAISNSHRSASIVDRSASLSRIIFELRLDIHSEGNENDSSCNDSDCDDSDCDDSDCDDSSSDEDSNEEED